MEVTLVTYVLHGTCIGSGWPARFSGQHSLAKVPAIGRQSDTQEDMARHGEVGCGELPG